jgi:hypothetical protein
MLIENLKALPVRVDADLAKRCEPRYMILEKAELDLRTDAGDIFYVKAIDVSDSGVGIFCRRPIAEQARIGLRPAFADSDNFELFEVRRQTLSIGGYTIGATAV